MASIVASAVARVPVWRRVYHRGQARVAHGRLSLRTEVAASTDTIANDSTTRCGASTGRRGWRTGWTWPTRGPHGGDGAGAVASACTEDGFPVPGRRQALRQVCTGGDVTRLGAARGRYFGASDARKKRTTSAFMLR